MISTVLTTILPRELLALVGALLAAATWTIAPAVAANTYTLGLAYIEVMAGPQPWPAAAPVHHGVTVIWPDGSVSK